jgi:predicted double-glycine peptidase
MIAFLFTWIAIAIGGSALWSIREPIDLPKNRFEIRQLSAVNGIITQPVRMEPFSEMKFRNIIRQAYDYSCGSAALVTLLNNDLGITVTEQDAMDGMITHGEKEKIMERRGFSLLDMKRYVASFGVVGAGFKGEIKDLAELKGPAIVPIDYAGFKHFVIFRGIRDGLVFIADPSAGNITFSVSEFKSLWDRNTLFIMTGPKDGLAPHRLALTDQELGVIDPDRMRKGASFSVTANTPLQLERQMNARTAVPGFRDAIPTGVSIYGR